MHTNKIYEWSGRRFGWTVVLTAVSVLIAGCGMHSSSGLSSSPGTATGSNLGVHGVVYGGQQPISNATIMLFATGTSGYSANNTNLLTVPVLTSATGTFNISNDYSCTTGQQMYIVAIGGNPGNGTNANAANMAALGDCAGLGPDTYIQMNEVTTIGSVFALAPFMTSYTALGTTSGNKAGLAQAYASVNKLVNIGVGSAIGSALPAGATGPTSEIYTLADIIAACINSTGGQAGDGSSCGNLFALTTPEGGIAPTNTIQAALNIAQNPTLNVSSLFKLPGSTAVPFQPELTNAPADWTLSIIYAPSGLSTPSTTTIDGSGNVWIANAGNNTVSVLSQAGVLTSTLTGNGLSSPAAIAIDAAGDAWVANKAAASISVFTSSGGIFTGSPLSGNGLARPSAVAIDAAGNVFATNSGANIVSEFSSSGAVVRELSSGVTTPTAVAVDPY